MTIRATAGSGTAKLRKAQTPNSVRLYVVDCGSLNIPDTSNYQLKKEDLATTTMAVPAIWWREGTLIWDVGAVHESSFKPGGGPATMRYASSLKPLTIQLAEIGYVPADITYMSFSHFHWDHIGNANTFATATWLVRKLERDIMFSDPPSTRTEPANYRALKNSTAVIVTKDEHDVFGDGAVILKSAPGHSPDHQVLFLKLPKPARCSAAISSLSGGRSSTRFRPRNSTSRKPSRREPPSRIPTKTGAQLGSSTTSRPTPSSRRRPRSTTSFTRISCRPDRRRHRPHVSDIVQRVLVQHQQVRRLALASVPKSFSMRNVSAAFWRS